MELRTLDPKADEQLFREAYDWIFEAPPWLRQAENIVAGINGCDSWEGYLKAAFSPKEFNIGLFHGIMLALFTIQREDNASFQVHVNAKPHAPAGEMIAASIQLRNALFAQGATEIFGFIAERNRPLRRFAEMAGFKFSGVSIFKGSMRDRPIRWMRYTVLREA
jgi:hypothetical protein